MGAENPHQKTIEVKLQNALDFFNLSPIQDQSWRSLTARLIYFSRTPRSLRKYWRLAVLSVNNQSPWREKKGKPDFDEALRESSMFLWQYLCELRKVERKQKIEDLWNHLREKLH
jgi:hypothetical protein